MALFGFFDYNRAGKGVSKNEPEKRAFFKFMDIFGRKFWKLFQLNLIYMIFCLPVVTIGPATAALTHVMRKFVLEQPIFVFSEFIDGFKKNWKQGMIIGLSDIALIALITYSIIYYQQVVSLDPSLKNTLLFAVTISTALFVLMMHFYIYPQIIALDLKLSNIIKNSFLLAIIGIKRTLISLVITVILVGLMLWFYPMTLLALPFLPAAWICFANVFICYPVIQKMIIIPHYKATGEKNPEIPDYVTNEEETLFEDFGGREKEIKGTKKPIFKGKVIR